MLVGLGFEAAEVPARPRDGWPRRLWTWGLQAETTPETNDGHMPALTQAPTASNRSVGHGMIGVHGATAASSTRRR